MSVPLAKKIEENAAFTLNTNQDLPTSSVNLQDYASLEALFAPNQTFRFRDENRFRDKQNWNQMQDSNKSYSSGKVLFRGKDQSNQLIDWPNNEYSIPFTFKATNGSSADKWVLKCGALGIIRGQTIKTTNNQTLVPNETTYAGPIYAKKFLLDNSSQRILTEGPYIGLFGFPADSSTVSAEWVAMANWTMNNVSWNSSLSQFEGELRIPFWTTSEYWGAQKVSQFGYNIDLDLYNSDGPGASEYVPFTYTGVGTNPQMTIGNSTQTNCYIYYSTVDLPRSSNEELAKDYERGLQNNCIFKTWAVAQTLSTAPLTYSALNIANEQVSQDFTRPTRIFMDFPTSGTLTASTGASATAGCSTGGYWPLQNQNVKLQNGTIKINSTTYNQNKMNSPYDFYDQVRDATFSRGDQMGQCNYNYAKYQLNPQYIFDVSRSPGLIGDPNKGVSEYLAYNVNTPISATGALVNKMVFIEQETAVVLDVTNQGTSIALGSAFAE